MSSSLWLPADRTADRTLTSGTLDEHEDGVADDHVTLWCDGACVADFVLPRGRGEAFLRDCGLKRHQSDSAQEPQG